MTANVHKLGLFILIALSFANAYADTAADARHPSPIATVGNGSLSVCVDKYAVACSSRWPSPGYYSQLSYSPHLDEDYRLTTRSENGLKWCIRLGGKILWLDGPPWMTTSRYRSNSSMVLESTSILPGTRTVVKQTQFVLPSRDVFVSRLKISGAQSSPDLIYSTNFSPTSTLVPQWLFTEKRFSAAADFASFAAVVPSAGTTLWHFRPDTPGRSDWKQARSVSLTDKDLSAKTVAFSEWLSFGEGTWIAYTSPDKVAAFQCGIDGTPTSAFQQAGTFSLQNERSAVGTTNSAIQVSPFTSADGSYTATVFVAFGSNYNETQKSLDYARNKSYESLLTATEEYWEEWIGNPQLSEAAPQKLKKIARRALLTIAVASDKTSGAVITAPHGRFAADWVRNGHWASLALDLADQSNLSEKHCQFYLKTIREQTTSGSPPGTMPAASYTNGQPASPNLLLDTSAVAWVLLGINLHSGFLGQDKKSDFLKASWQGADAMAEFLLSWRDARTRLPLHSFDYDKWRDAVSYRQIILDYIALQSAIGIAKELGHERPAWTNRAEELKDLIEQHCFDPESNWVKELDPEHLLLLERYSDLLGKKNALALEETAIKKIHDDDPQNAMRVLAECAYAWRKQPRKLDKLEPLIEAVVTEAIRTGDPTDTRQAALAFIAISCAYPLSEEASE